MGIAHYTVTALEIESLLASYLLEKKKWRRAHEVAEAVIEGLDSERGPTRDPQRTLAIHQDCAFAALQDKEHAKCLALCEKVLSLDPGNAVCLCYKAEALFAQGALAEADTCLEHLLARLEREDLLAECAPDTPGFMLKQLAARAYGNRALVQITLSEPLVALQLLKAAVLLSPTTVEPRYNYCVLSFKLGQKTHAASEWLLFVGVGIRSERALLEEKGGELQAGRGAPTVSNPFEVVTKEQSDQLTATMLRYAATNGLAEQTNKM